MNAVYIEFFTINYYEISYYISKKKRISLMICNFKYKFDHYLHAKAMYS